MQIHSIFAALALCAILAAGCGTPPAKLSPQAEKFKKETLSTLDELGRKLLPVLKAEQTRPGNQPGESCQDAVKKIYEKAAKEGRPLPYLMGLLDKMGVVQAYWGPPQARKDRNLDVGSLGNDYSHLNKLDPVYDNSQATGFEVYYTHDSHYFMVCGPVPPRDELFGAVCLAYSAQALKDLYGLDKKGFESIDFKN